MTRPISHEEIKRAAQLLSEGELVAFPTETVYGLGADARNEAAVRRIFQVKGRPTNNPLIVHVADVESALSVVDIARSFSPAEVRRRFDALKHLWPGPLSLVLPKLPSIAPSVSAGGDSVAVRIPNHPVALQLLQTCGVPVAAPSANRSLYVSPTTAAHVQEDLGGTVALILDGGPCQVGLESTVLSLLEETPRVLRPGAVTTQQIEAALGCPVSAASRSVDSSAPLLSPGMLAKHYSPRTPVLLRSVVTPTTPLPKRIGAILFSPCPLPFPTTELRILSPTGDLTHIAASLFAALRELDKSNVDLIIVDTCQPAGLGEAIMDRLLRAASTEG
jgi:L-threonylcarbamoyladenylate synthase